MDYIILFLYGIITFISPCILPMLPIYISYFAGAKDNSQKGRALLNSIGFVIGFTLIFVLLGAFASTLGKMYYQYKPILNIVMGLIIIIFGLNFMEVLSIPFLNRNKGYNISKLGNEFFSSILFGVIFSIGWTPCVGAFLGTALMLAASETEKAKGVIMLLTYSLGLGLPFILSAVLIENLKSTFNFIKRNYRVINMISGILLVLVGILMVTGYLGYFLSLLTF